jgi:hypothetical protein
MFYEIKNFFYNHPNKVCLTYNTHFKLSMTLSIKFAIASFKALIHALFPPFFISSSTNTVNEINELLIQNKCK